VIALWPAGEIITDLCHPAVLGVLADLGVVQVRDLKPVAHAHKVAVAAEEDHHMVHLVPPAQDQWKIRDSSINLTSPSGRIDFHSILFVTPA
jgi:hypothetical protein